MKTLRTQLAILLLFALCSLTSTYAQIKPLGDSYTNTADPTKNYGAATLLDVVGATQITYIQFNLASIPTGGMTWHGWHAFRRGIASNLFALGVNEKIVQRILRHSKPHVTKERYIKAFDSDVIAAMRKMVETIAELRSLRETNKRQWN
jgi:hypothetical protein